MLPKQRNSDDRQAGTLDRRTLLINGGFGPLLLKGQHHEELRIRNTLSNLLRHDAVHCCTDDDTLRRTT